MSRTFSFHPLATEELHEATAWYQVESEQLARSFLGELDRVIRGILEKPYLGTPLTRRVRRRLLRVFPYGLLYEVRGENVRILAVANLHRRPRYWRGRR